MDEWIQSAVKKGATLLCGGKREGVMVEATLLEGVARDERRGGHERRSRRRVSRARDALDAMGLGPIASSRHAKSYGAKVLRCPVVYKKLAMGWPGAFLT